ncbi:MAG: GCN5-related N-acetyltransferase [Sphingomonadaceae bacterium]|jgi:hypothetical protein|nr:MAG: GCN5-related N-acetyltransferase [Sphingomonadaceae bacterium]
MSDGGGAERSRADLEAEWLELTRGILPGLARSRVWPVRADHCFQRILLDAVVGGVWYDAVAGRPAYRYIDGGLLARAVALGHDVAEGRVDLGELNRRSLAWRRVRKDSSPRSVTPDLFRSPPGRGGRV